MHTPFASLAWELWRKNRACNIALVGLLALGGICRVVTFYVPIPDDGAAGLAICALILTFLSLVSVFSCADSGVQIAFPARTFALPISTSTLVNGPVLLGAVVLTMFHAAWAYLFLAPRIPHYPFGEFTLLLIAALLAFQASVWCLSAFPNLLAVELSLLGAALVILANRVGTESAAQSFALARGMNIPENRLTLACIWLLLAFSYGSAWLGVRLHRHGYWQAIPAPDLMENRAATWFGSGRNLLTPARSQSWIERRRNAVAPFILGVVGAAGFALLEDRVIHADDFYPGGISTIWVFFFSFIATFWAAVSGLFVATDASWGGLRLSQFLATRPIASGGLAWAKVKLAYRLTVAGWLVYGAGAAIWIANLHQHGRWPREDEMTALGLTFCIMPWFLIGALPLWLTGVMRSVPSAGLFLIGASIGIGNVIGYFSEHFGIYSRLILAVLPCSFAVKILISAWAFAQCYRQRLLRPSQIAAAVVIWLAGTAVFLTLAFKFSAQAQIPRPVAVWLAALLFPLARVALAPLAAARARHR